MEMSECPETKDDEPSKSDETEPTTTAIQKPTRPPEVDPEPKTEQKSYIEDSDPTMGGDVEKAVPTIAKQYPHPKPPPKKRGS